MAVSQLKISQPTARAELRIANKKACALMPVTIFPRKTIKKSMFFMFGDYCRDSNSKYTHHSTALQKRVFFMMERSQK